LVDAGVTITSGLGDSFGTSSLSSFFSRAHYSFLNEAISLLKNSSFS
jgi:hypothetical protein